MASPTVLSRPMAPIGGLARFLSFNNPPTVRNSVMAPKARWNFMNPALAVTRTRSDPNLFVTGFGPIWVRSDSRDVSVRNSTGWLYPKSASTWDDRTPLWWLITEAMEDQSRKNHGETVDLSWLDSVDPEIEQRLLPMERAILAALRSYRAIFVTNPAREPRAPPRS